MPAITDLPIQNELGYEIKTQGTTDTTPTTYTYVGSMNGYVFRNDGGVNITFKVNSNAAVTVAPGEVVNGLIPISSFTINAASGVASWTMRAFEILNGSNSSPLLTFQSAAAANGNGTAIDISTYATLSIDVVITGSATVNFEVSNDGTNFISIYNTPSTGTVAFLSTIFTTRGIRFETAGYKYFRARISSYSSGTVDVFGYGSTLVTFPALPFNTVSGDGAASPFITLATGSMLQAFNGTAWDRVRSATPSDTMSASLISLASASQTMIYDGTNWTRVRVASGISDGNAGGTITATSMMAYAGANFERLRVAKVQRFQEYLTLPTGTTFTVWSPTSTKTLRIMGLSVSVSGACALNVRVGTAGSGSRIACLRFSGAGNYLLDLGQGYKATNATTDVLEINNPSANPTSATVDVHVLAWGTEE